jgi:hypothetical protein
VKLEEYIEAAYRATDAEFGKSHDPGDEPDTSA